MQKGPAKNPKTAAAGLSFGRKNPRELPSAFSAVTTWAKVGKAVISGVLSPVVAHKADAAGGRGQVGPLGPRRDQTERIALVQAAHGSTRRIVKPEILYDPPDRVERPGALADHIVQALTAGADVLSACPGALVFSV